MRRRNPQKRQEENNTRTKVVSFKKIGLDLIPRDRKKL